mmetsp:Transcript_12198/g.22614  ORF Transcript_12198/g.22614 Transcript_12198/m.22614 type:complete len:89 (-) Transcript_12198:534-800(-)
MLLSGYYLMGALQLNELLCTVDKGLELGLRTFFPSLARLFLRSSVLAKFFVFGMLMTGGVFSSTNGLRCRLFFKCLVVGLEILSVGLV